MIVRVAVPRLKRYVAFETPMVSPTGEKTRARVGPVRVTLSALGPAACQSSPVSPAARMARVSGRMVS